MTDDEIETLWLYARRLWPLFEIPEGEELRALQAEAWRDVLGEVPAGGVRAAMVALADEQYPPPLGQMRQERLHLGLAQQRGMTPPVKHDEPLHPADVRLLRPRTVMARAHGRPQTAQKRRRLGRRMRG